MISKSLKYVSYIFFTLMLLYFSVDFKQLDEVKLAEKQKTINTEQYARDFWENKVPQLFPGAVLVDSLITGLINNREYALDKYTKKVGIGTWSCFIKGRGKIKDISNDGFLVGMQKPLQEYKILIVTNYIFGNTVRDASGLVKSEQFSNSMEYNKFSNYLNKIIRNELVPVIIDKIKLTNSIEYIGAISLSENQMDKKSLKIIPVKLKVITDELR